jgi:hypothetical protein
LCQFLVEVDEGNPALLVETATGEQAWLPYGEPTAIALNSFPADSANAADPENSFTDSDSNSEILAAFAPKMLQLPFVIKLEDFIIDRNEGTDSVAMWTSKIRIANPFTGESSDRQVWMNHPTWYRGWKLAQASWNPGDLRQSTLQVKREPAWVTALTWSGSALVVLGIGVMFYGRSAMQFLINSPFPECRDYNRPRVTMPRSIRLN